MLVYSNILISRLEYPDFFLLSDIFIVIVLSITIQTQDKYVYTNNNFFILYCFKKE